MGKIRLHDVTAKVMQYATKNNGHIIKFREMERKPIKGKGPKHPRPPRPKVWEAIDELRVGISEILTEMRAGFKTVFQFIEEQKVVNAEQKVFNTKVENFMTEQKVVNAEVKDFIDEQKVVNADQKKFNEEIKNKLENIIVKNNLKE